MILYQNCSFYFVGTALLPNKRTPKSGFPVLSSMDDFFLTNAISVINKTPFSPLLSEIHCQREQQKCSLYWSKPYYFLFVIHSENLFFLFFIFSCKKKICKQCNFNKSFRWMVVIEKLRCLYATWNFIVSQEKGMEKILMSFYIYACRHQVFLLWSLQLIFKWAECRSTS